MRHVGVNWANRRTVVVLWGDVCAVTLGQNRASLPLPFSVMCSAIAEKGQSYLEFWGEYHLCTLTTIRPDGRPHVVPVGVTVDAEAGKARVITLKSSKKIANILAALPGQAGVAVCQVDGGRWATLEGTAEILTDAVAVEDAMARYADRYGRMPAPNPDRVVIEITIDRAMGQTELPQHGQQKAG